MIRLRATGSCRAPQKILVLAAAFFITMMAAGSAAEVPGLRPGNFFVDPLWPVEVCDLKAPSLDRVLDVLVERGGVREASTNDTYVAYERLDFTRIWTFTRPAHPAHPAVVCRNLSEGAAGLSVEMFLFCGGPPDACATLIRDFEELNAEMRATATRRE